jgi:hypothetical protein
MTAEERARLSEQCQAAHQRARAAHVAAVVALARSHVIATAWVEQWVLYQEEQWRYQQARSKLPPHLATDLDRIPALDADRWRGGGRTGWRL